MSQYPLYQVDAFTDRPLGGNPCAVIFDTDDMSDATMQAVAQEMNLSETAFVRRSDIADFGARYFTPAEEIPMAGHPTIATTYALIDSGRLTLTGDHTRITLELPVGPITVDIEAKDGKVINIIMTQLKPEYLAELPAAEVAPVFGLKPDDLLPGVPVQIVSTGTPQLMVALRDHAALRKAELHMGPYIALRNRTGFFSPHLFCTGGATQEGDTFARHFGVPPDTTEDPFTGSATGGMAAFLWRYNLIPKARFVAEQGHWINRPGQAMVEVTGSREDPQSVRVGGSAVTVMVGTLLL